MGAHEHGAGRTGDRWQQRRPDEDDAALRRGILATIAIVVGLVALWPSGDDDARVAAAGGPTQALQILVYPDYAFLAYRDPVDPANIDRRMWRAGAVDEAGPNPIEDRVDPDTEVLLFALSDVDLNGLPTLTADAPARFGLPVGVTHIIIDRFLPFDERVLIRVYATPTDGRSGGGYVQYTLDGTFVKVVQ